MKVNQAKRRWMIGTIVGVTIAFVCWMIFRIPDVSFEVPDPNGYDLFLNAASKTGYLDLNYNDPVSLKKLIQANMETIELVEEGLQQECRVPFRKITPDQKGSTKLATEGGNLKRVQHILIARAKLLESEGKVNEAFEAFIIAYRFAHESGRGGIGLDYVNELSRKALVMGQFKRVATRLNPLQSKHMIELMDVIENDPEIELQAVMARNLRWAVDTYGVASRLQVWKNTLTEMIRSRSFKPFQNMRQPFHTKTQKYVTQYVKPMRVILESNIKQTESPTSD